MARWGGLSSLQDQRSSECLRLNPPPTPPRLLRPLCTLLFHPALPSTLPPKQPPAAKWTSLWAFDWGLGIRRLPTRSPLHPQGVDLQPPLPACPVPLPPVPAPVPAALLPHAPALLVPQMPLLPALPVQASLARPARVLALLALHVLPQRVRTPTASPALVHLRPTAAPRPAPVTLVPRAKLPVGARAWAAVAAAAAAVVLHGGLGAPRAAAVSASGDRGLLEGSAR